MTMRERRIVNRMRRKSQVPIAESWTLNPDLFRWLLHK